MLDGMTNIKASEVLKEIKYYTEDLPPYSPDEVAEALEMAIKALEQKDALEKIRAEIIELRSRQNVGVMECLDIIDKYREGGAE